MFDFKHGYMYKKYRTPESIPHIKSIISKTSEHDEQDGMSRSDRTRLFDVRLDQVITITPKVVRNTCL